MDSQRSKAPPNFFILIQKQIKTYQSKKMYPMKFKNVSLLTVSIAFLLFGTLSLNAFAGKSSFVQYLA